MLGWLPPWIAVCAREGRCGSAQPEKAHCQILASCLELQRNKRLPAWGSCHLGRLQACVVWPPCAQDREAHMADYPALSQPHVFVLQVGSPAWAEKLTRGTLPSAVLVQPMSHLCLLLACPSGPKAAVVPPPAPAQPSIPVGHPAGRVQGLLEGARRAVRGGLHPHGPPRLHAAAQGGPGCWRSFCGQEGRRRSTPAQLTCPADALPSAALPRSAACEEKRNPACWQPVPPLAVLLAMPATPWPCCSGLEQAMHTALWHVMPVAG